MTHLFPLVDLFESRRLNLLYGGRKMLLHWICIQSTFPIHGVEIKITLELGETFRGRIKFISKQIEREISNKVTARYFTA